MQGRGRAAEGLPGEEEDPRVQEYAGEASRRRAELSEQIDRQKQWVAERCEIVKATLIGHLEDCQAKLRDGVSARVGEWHEAGREIQHLRRQLLHTDALVADLHQCASRAARGGEIHP